VLPAVSSSKPKGDAPAIVEDVAQVQEDIDAAFQDTVTRAVSKPIKVQSIEKPTMDVRIYLYCFIVLTGIDKLAFIRMTTRLSGRDWSRLGY
jgi:hypothetical protein